MSVKRFYFINILLNKFLKNTNFNLNFYREMSNEYDILNDLLGKTV